MVPEIYGDEVPPSMFPAAARSVLAHLLKLEREERVSRTGRGDDARFAVLRTKPCERCGRPARPGSRYCRRCALAVLQEEPSPGRDRRPGPDREPGVDREPSAPEVPE
jgi:hypothetical protein